MVACDVKDAFNCIERKMLVESVSRTCPAVAPFATWSLQETVLVLKEMPERTSYRRTVQGDLLSANLVAL